MSGLVDIGVNLTSKQFRADVDAVIDRARSGGVDKFVVTGLSTEVSWRAAELAARYPGVLFSTSGIHPHNVGRASRDAVSELRRIASATQVVAIGETGLDYNRDFSPRLVQRRMFAAQLALAAELGLPVFLHERDAHQEFVAILREHRAALSGGVVHCFTSSPSALEDYLDLDLHIGLTGYICDPRRGAHLVELAKRIPDSRLMIETDAPFLRPRDLSGAGGRRNEPANLPHIAAAIARARSQTVAELSTVTTANATRFFALEPVASAEVAGVAAIGR